MKKKLLALLAVLTLACAAGGCSLSEGWGDSQGNAVNSQTPTTSEVPEVSETPETSENAKPETSEGGAETPDSTHEYKSFTPAEKNLFMQYIGDVIPFLPNDEYYVEGYYDETDYENGMCFYTLGNTQAEYNAYRNGYLTAGYEFVESYVDEEYGDTWYCYQKDDIYVEMTRYTYENFDVVEVYVISSLSEDSGDVGGGDIGGDEGEDVGGSENTGNHKYTGFTSYEKGLFTQYIGAVIPFIPNDEYYVEGYYDTSDYENGMNFYTFGNTQAEFNAYRNGYLTAGYEFVESYEDTYGDTWYCYQKQDIVVDLSFYYYEGDYVVDVYVYSSLSEDGGDVGGDDWGDDWGDIGGGSTDVDLITNEGKGLPTSASGVYNVDFTKAKYVKNVMEQGYYLDGCPTVSTTKDPAVLVIPVEFSNCTAASKGYTTAAINKAFNGNAGETTYYSVKEYFSISSYGKLDLDITVLDSWFRPKNTSSYYEKQTMTLDGYDVAIGDQMIMDEALAYLESRMDLSKFDSDGNGIIDAVVMIYTLDIDENKDFQWAYRYWNYYTDDDGYYYEYDKVSANDYVWASYQFMLEQYDKNGNTYYDKSVINPYTYIHEFSHILGADDYYDTAYVNHPMGGYDMMDSMMGDHNPYTKFNYGWLTSSRLVVAQSSVTLTLEAFEKSGDTIIIANNWDSDLGVYQEYYIVMYYKYSGLNDNDMGYFEKDGILVYHVNASLYAQEYEGETYYDIYNTNTDPSDQNGYGTEDNLIEFVQSSSRDYVYGKGDSLPSNTKDDFGNKIAYTFTVDSLTKDSATLTFTKN